MLTHIYKTISSLDNMVLARDPRIDQISSLIEQYNAAPGLPQLRILEQIEHLSSQLREEYRGNPQANNEFMMWLAQDSLQKELAHLSNKPNAVDSSKKLLLELQGEAHPALPTTAQWKRATTPRKTSLIGGFVETRSTQYRSIDPLLHQIKLLEAEQHQGFPPSLELITAVDNLRNHLLNMQIPPDKPLMTERVNLLLAHSGSYLNTLIEAHAEQKASYETTSSTDLIPSRTLIDKEQLTPIVQHLASSRENLTIGNFETRFLGGRNNLNWLARNEETGERHIIRLEPAGEVEPLYLATDYSLIEEVKSSARLNRFIAQDRDFFPTGEVVIQGTRRLFNLAISEFCPRGDLIRAINQQHGANPSEADDPRNDEIIHSITNMMEQAAAMADSFSKEGKIYPDFKAENLLIREDNSVITADLKTVKRTTDGLIVANHLDSTPAYDPPECDNARALINAEKFMSYQMGLMCYMLMTRLSGEAKYQALDNLKAGDGLDFNYPIFRTAEGEQMRAIIEACINNDPQQRPSPEALQGQFNTIKLELDAKEEHEAPLAMHP